jgi:hypothetical protein
MYLNGGRRLKRVFSPKARREREIREEKETAKEQIV